MKKLWGTTGIRGPADTLLTNQFVFDIGRAFAMFLKKNKQKGTVVVGRDPRESSPRIAKALMTGIFSEGYEIEYAGVTPIPSINRALLAQNPVVAGCMVTGSHIEKSLNGIKFFAFEEEILKKHEKDIGRVYRSIKEKKLFKAARKFTRSKQTKQDYVEYLTELSEDLPKLRIVVDPGNGSQTEAVVEILSRLGTRIIKLNSSLKRPMLARDTEKAEDFSTLCKKVKESKADLGVGFDSDGDRAIFCDDNGKLIFGDYLGAIIAKYNQLDAIVTPINTSIILESISPKVVRTKVGSSFVVAAMRKNNISFGFESNGGVVMAPMMTRDGGRAMIEILNILAREKKPLSEIYDSMPETVILKDKVKYKWEQEKTILKAVKAKYTGKKTDTTDGLKIYLSKKSWILFRSSKNSPEFRVFVEAPTRKKARQLINEGLKLVLKYV